MKPRNTRLEIRMTAGAEAPVPGSASWDVHVGGPAVLLGWLETQLGLQAVETPLPDRIARLASALDQIDPPTIVRSLLRDRWSTARECLRRIDELRLGGWNGEDDG